MAVRSARAETAGQHLAFAGKAGAFFQLEFNAGQGFVESPTTKTDGASRARVVADMNDL